MASWSCRSVITPRSRRMRASMGSGSPPRKGGYCSSPPPSFPGPRALGYHPRQLVPDAILPYHDRLPELEKELMETGHLGILVLDASPLAAIEDQYGIEA